MSISEPGKIITPWAESGLKNEIPPVSNNTSGRAGFDQGFPPVTMTPPEVGGLPPQGQDFNGIFYQITEIIRYIQAGGQPFFSAVLSSAIGGYPKGCVILGSDAITLWQNQIDSNTNDPNLTQTGWLKVDVNLKALLASSSGSSMIGRGSLTVEESLYDIELQQGARFKMASLVARDLAAGATQSFSCYGDSTMWGATVGALGTQDPNNPPSRLQIAINLIYGLSVTVNNRAISGSTLRQMISGTDGSGSTFASKMAAGGVDADTAVIVCNHGTNDSQTNGDTTQYRKDLVDFISICRKEGAVPVLCTPTPAPSVLITTEEKGKRLRNFVRVIREVAESMGVDLIDQYAIFESSFSQYKPEELFPDGIHLSSDAYRQAGFNLAMPFCSFQAIGVAGDFSTLTNVSYFDNFTVNRQIQTQPSRVGQIITASRPASGGQGINYPVFLDGAQKVVSFIGLQWNDAANCSVSDNGVAVGAHYQQKQFGNQSSLDWDSDCKFYGRRMAGLHLFSLAFNMTTLGLGAGLTFGGVAIPAQAVNSITGAIAQPDPYTKSVADASDTIICRTTVGAGGVYFTDKSGSPVLVARLDAGVFTVDLYKNGAIVQTGTAGSGLTEREYGLAIRLNETSVNVTLEALTVTLTTTTKLPNLKPYTSFLRYSIAPTFGV